MIDKDSPPGAWERETERRRGWDEVRALRQLVEAQRQVIELLKPTPSAPPEPTDWVLIDVGEPDREPTWCATCGRMITSGNECITCRMSL